MKGRLIGLAKWALRIRPRNALIVSGILWAAGIVLSYPTFMGYLFYMPCYAFAVLFGQLAAMADVYQKDRQYEIEALRGLAARMRVCLDDLREFTSGREPTEREQHLITWLERMIPVAESGHIEAARELWPALEKQGHFVSVPDVEDETPHTIH